MKAQFLVKMVLVLACFGLVLSPVVFDSTVSAIPLTEKYEVVMKDYKFHISKNGESVHELKLTGGLPTQIVVRNDDLVAHEFTSTLFKRVPVSMSGNATLVSTDKAQGFRVNPGQNVMLEFVPPINPEGDIDFDVFYCNIHGDHPNAEMRGEVLTVPTITGTGAF